MERQNNPGVTLGYSVGPDNSLAFPDVRICAETYEPGIQLFPLSFTSVQAQCTLADLAVEQPGVQNEPFATIQPTTPELAAAYPSLFLENLTMTPTSNCPAHQAVQCLTNIHECGLAHAPCLQFSFRDAAVQYGSPEAVFTALFFDLGVGQQKDANCQSFKPSPSASQPNDAYFTAFRLMVMLDPGLGAFDGCVERPQAVWLPMGMWSSVTLLPTTRTHLNGSKIRFYDFRVATVSIYNAALEPVANLNNASQRIVVTWTLDPRGSLEITEQSPWPGFAASCLASLSIYSLFGLLFAYPGPVMTRSRPWRAAASMAQRWRARCMQRGGGAAGQSGLQAWVGQPTDGPPTGDIKPVSSDEQAVTAD